MSAFGSVDLLAWVQGKEMRPLMKELSLLSATFLVGLAMLEMVLHWAGA